MIGIALALLIAGAVAGFFRMKSGQRGDYVQIFVQGSLYQDVSLHKDQVIEVERDGHINRVQIQNGQARMIEADCPDKRCIQQGAIDHSPQMIVCLPNQVVISCKEENTDVDGMAQ